MLGVPSHWLLWYSTKHSNAVTLIYGMVQASDVRIQIRIRIRIRIQDILSWIRIRIQT